jgi:putative peptide zinc metalloprotease protein
VSRHLLLHLPQINRALWHAGSRQAQLMSAHLADHSYAMAALDVVGIVLATLSVAGSLYIMIALARRLALAGLRWSAGRPPRRLLAAAACLAVLAALAMFWSTQGQFHGW